MKKSTGDTASNFIRRYIIQLAKNALASGKSVSQVAYGLGFEYTQYFSRIFKKETGISPSSYCAKIRKKAVE